MRATEPRPPRRSTRDSLPLSAQAISHSLAYIFAATLCDEPRSDGDSSSPVRAAFAVPASYSPLPTAMRSAEPASSPVSNRSCRNATCASVADWSSAFSVSTNDFSYSFMRAETSFFSSFPMRFALYMNTPGPAKNGMAVPRLLKYRPSPETIHGLFAAIPTASR